MGNVYFNLKGGFKSHNTDKRKGRGEMKTNR